MHTSYDFLTIPEIADLFYISSATLRPALGFTQQLDTEDPEKVVVDSQILQPIFDGVDTDGVNRKVVGMVLLRLPLLELFQNRFLHGIFGVVAVLRSSCTIGTGLLVEETSELSYLINGGSAVFLGPIDAHNSKFDALEVSKVVVDLDFDSTKVPEGLCVPKLTMHLYPSEELESAFQTSKPIMYTAVMVTIFVFTSLVFLLYDFFVGRRQRKVMERIIEQDKIVSNVFPAAIRDRLYVGQDRSQQDDLLDPLNVLGNSNDIRGAPLADLFPNTTVIFADIAGFTAWASAREPQQVFILLETIYGAFDRLAYRHDIFKVETVGDCYVAVAGLPEPSDDHAVAVSKFAVDCLKKMKEMTLKLEITLGPDTADLGLRVGIHR
jgi:hypothetical protein